MSRGADRAPDFGSSVLGRVLIACVVLKITGLVILFSWDGQFGFDVPKALWSRALEWPTAGALALALYRHGPALIPRTRFHLVVAGFVLVNVISLLFAENTYIAMYGERNRYLGLTNVIDLALLYFAIVVAFRRPRDWALLWSAAGGAVLVAVAYGVVQSRGLDPISWTTNPQVRPFGTIGNPDQYGHLLAATVAACAAIAFVSSRHILRYTAIGLGSASLGMLAIIGTRGSLVAAGSALLFGGAVSLVSLGRAARTSPKARLGIVGGGIGVGIALLAALALTPTGWRLLSSAETADRVLIWRGSWSAFLERPLFGWGPDSLAAAFGRTRPEGMESVFPQGFLFSDQAHNWILQALATTGVVGTLALVALVAGATALLVREGRGPSAVFAWPLILVALAYWVNALTSPESVSVGWIPWVVFAGATWLASEAPVTLPAVRRLPMPVAAGVLGAALLIATSGWNAYRANAEIVRAVIAYPGDAAVTIAAASSAIALDPGRGDYYNYLGLGLQLRGQFASAAAQFEDATRRVPYQPAYWINLSRARMFQVQSGDQSGGGARAALAAAQRGVDVDPRLHSAHRNYAEVALALGDADLAFDEARIAFDIYARDPLNDVVLAASARQIPDHELARRALEAALARTNNAVLWGGLAQVHLAAGNLTAARAAAVQALLLDPDNADGKKVEAATGQ